MTNDEDFKKFAKKCYNNICLPNGIIQCTHMNNCSAKCNTDKCPEWNNKK